MLFFFFLQHANTLTTFYTEIEFRLESYLFNNIWMYYAMEIYVQNSKQSSQNTVTTLWCYGSDCTALFSLLMFSTL